jgi:hypothetical protein
VIEDDITSQKRRYHIEGREKNGEIEVPVTMGNKSRKSLLHFLDPSITPLLDLNKIISINTSN